MVLNSQALGWSWESFVGVGFGFGVGFSFSFLRFYLSFTYFIIFFWFSVFLAALGGSEAPLAGSGCLRGTFCVF